MAALWNRYTWSANLAVKPMPRRFWAGGWVHEVADGREDGGDRFIVAFEPGFEFIELASRGGKSSDDPRTHCRKILEDQESGDFVADRTAAEWNGGFEPDREYVRHGRFPKAPVTLGD